jgi:DNA-binding MarR family transcriptional regulator
MKQLYDESDLTFSETSVLTRLDLGGPATPTALAGAEHVRPQAMGNTLSALEERELITRRPEPSDRRKVLIEIAPAGKQLLASKRQMVSASVDDAIAAEFNDSELQQIARVVPLLERLADTL